MRATSRPRLCTVAKIANLPEWRSVVVIFVTLARSVLRLYGFSHIKYNCLCSDLMCGPGPLRSSLLLGSYIVVSSPRTVGVAGK